MYYNITLVRIARFKDNMYYYNIRIPLRTTQKKNIIILPNLAIPHLCSHVLKKN